MERLSLSLLIEHRWRDGAVAPTLHVGHSVPQGIGPLVQGDQGWRGAEPSAPTEPTPGCESYPLAGAWFSESYFM